MKKFSTENRGFKSPLITIGITSYNAAATIERAFRSAQNQDWESKEIIIVDDASSDDSAEIITRLCSGVSGAKFYLLDNNLGVANARNTIIENATGEFLAFFDDDDISDPRRLRLQYERIVRFEDLSSSRPLVVCHTARRQDFGDGRIRTAPTMGCAKDKSVPSGPALAQWFLTGLPLGAFYGACATCSQMARIGVYRALGGFDSSFRRSEDTEFNIRVAMAGGSFLGIEDCLVSQTITKGSDKGLRNEWQWSKKLLQKHASFVETHSCLKTAEKWIDFKYSLLLREYCNAAQYAAGAFIHSPVVTLGRILVAIKSLRAHLALANFYRDRRSVTRNSYLEKGDE